MQTQGKRSMSDLIISILTSNIIEKTSIVMAFRKEILAIKPWVLTPYAALLLIENGVSLMEMIPFQMHFVLMADAASQAGDADSSRAPGLTSVLQGSVIVHRGALLLVPQWQCISSFVFYIFVTLVPFAVWSW